MRVVQFFESPSFLLSRAVELARDGRAVLVVSATDESYRSKERVMREYVSDLGEEARRVLSFVEHVRLGQFVERYDRTGGSSMQCCILLDGACVARRAGWAGERAFVAVNRLRDQAVQTEVRVAPSADQALRQATEAATRGGTVLLVSAHAAGVVSKRAKLRSDLPVRHVTAEAFGRHGLGSHLGWGYDLIIVEAGATNTPFVRTCSLEVARSVDSRIRDIQERGTTVDRRRAVVISETGVTESVVGELESLVRDELGRGRHVWIVARDSSRADVLFDGVAAKLLGDRDRFRLPPDSSPRSMQHMTTGARMLALASRHYVQDVQGLCGVTTVMVCDTMLRDGWRDREWFDAAQRAAMPQAPAKPKPSPQAQTYNLTSSASVKVKPVDHFVTHQGKVLRSKAEDREHSRARVCEVASRRKVALVCATVAERDEADDYFDKLERCGFRKIRRNVLAVTEDQFLAGLDPSYDVSMAESVRQKVGPNSVSAMALARSRKGMRADGDRRAQRGWLLGLAVGGAIVFVPALLILLDITREL